MQIQQFWMTAIENRQHMQGTILHRLYSLGGSTVLGGNLRSLIGASCYYYYYYYNMRHE